MFARLLTAWRAFWFAWRHPEECQKWIEPPQKQKEASSADTSHLRLLFFLQQGSRLIDFLKEDISAFSDAQVGAAVRKIHQDSRQVIEELVTIRPLRDEAEGAQMTILKGYNPSEIKLVGKLKGEPPYKGTLVHRGWKAHKRSLPAQLGDISVEIISPAEVELS